MIIASYLTYHGNDLPDSILDQLGMFSLNTRQVIYDPCIHLLDDLIMSTCRGKVRYLEGK